MTTGARRYVAIETGGSILINIVISAAFVFIAFGRLTSIDLWGGHGLAIDFIPQTFMITLMSVLIPTILTRKRIRSGSIGPWATTPFAWRIDNLAVRALVMALVATVVLGGTAVILLSATWTGPVPFWRVFGWKLAYGALVSIAVTPPGLIMALSETGRMTHDRDLAP